MNCDIKISVVIPVYKTEKYLRSAVDSILNQTYKNLEVILVDDGSPDNCPALCDEIVKRNFNVSVIHKENGGLSSARNAGIEVAKGKYILFLDSDDTLEENAIKEMLEIAEKESADAVLPNSYYKTYEDKENKDLALLFKKEMFSSVPQDFALNVQIGETRGYRSTAVLYRLNVILDNNIRFPLGKISEDYFYNLDFMSVAKKIALYDKPSLNNLKRSGSITSSFHKNFAETIWSMDEYSRNFAKNSNIKNEDSVKKLDSQLCRNIVVYLFSIMSPQNPMSYKEKKEYAHSVLKDEKARNVWKKKNEVPFFESKITLVAFNIVYILLRLRLINLALFIMSFVK